MCDQNAALGPPKSGHVSFTRLIKPVAIFILVLILTIVFTVGMHFNLVQVHVVDDLEIQNQTLGEERDTTFKFENISSKYKIANSTCVIIGCHSRDTPGHDIFWKYYSQLGYTTILISFSALWMNERRIAPHWCRVGVAMREIARHPTSRVLYVDIDTRLSNIQKWCNMPYLGVHAPIIMTSLYRANAVRVKQFTVHGTQIQTNAFVVAPGEVGMNALRRWQQGYGHFPYADQGALHVQEQGLCGVPGWIHCYGNPEQQGCHCTGIRNSTLKEACIAKLFAGKLPSCGTW